MSAHFIDEDVRVFDTSVSSDLYKPKQYHANCSSSSQFLPTRLAR